MLICWAIRFLSENFSGNSILSRTQTDRTQWWPQGFRFEVIAAVD